MANREYFVSIPIAGSAMFVVEASDPESAKAKAWKEIEKGVEPSVEWEYFEKISSGHVLHVSQNEVEIQLVSVSGARIASELLIEAKRKR